MTWECPKCGSKELSVTVTAQAELHQLPDGNFETDVDGSDHEWDGCSLMSCVECGYCEASSSFEVSDD